MRIHFLTAFLAALTGATCVAGSTRPPDLVFVEGGTFRHMRSAYQRDGVTLASFLIGKYEVTQQEWRSVMGSNPSHFQGDDLPVENVSWYESIEYCNRRSVKEGLAPYYRIDRDTKDPTNENPEDDVKWTVTIDATATGYRLPTEAEWEYAAGGGQRSRSFVYCGGDDADALGWYWQNSGDAPLAGAWNWPAIERNRNRTQPVGRKAPNELGLHDMLGNVREWCWDWASETTGTGANPQGSPRGGARIWKGGGWMGADFCGEPSFRAAFEPHSRGNDQGLRVCRNAP